MKHSAIEFGTFIRQIRLKNVITARAAAENARWLPSNFSKLEHGVILPPKDPDRQKEIAAAIGIEPNTKEETEFFDLAAAATRSVPVDIAEIISREDALPLLLRTIGNKRLTKEEIERLVNIVRGTDGKNARQDARGA